MSEYGNIGNVNHTVAIDIAHLVLFRARLPEILQNEADIADVHGVVMVDIVESTVALAGHDFAAKCTVQ